MQLFYSETIEDEHIIFENQELQHLRVLRLSIGSEFQSMDGKGNLFHVELVELNKKLAKAKILKQEYHKKTSHYRLHIGIAPTKNIDRIEFFVEKAIELGIDEISFLKTARSERKNLKEDRIKKIALAACKQSLSLHLPKLNFEVSLNQLINEDQAPNKLIAHCLEDQQKVQLNKEVSDHCTVLIGPEGDFKEEEIQLALTKGYKPLNLGKSRLRTETAGIFVCAAMRSLNT